MRKFCGTFSAMTLSERPHKWISGVTPANQTKKRPVHELFPGAFRNKSSRCESCLFSEGKNTRIHTEMGAKFTWTFRFGPFFGFREGANREKLTVKKIINNEMLFLTVYIPYKPWKIGVNREKISTKPWKNRHQKSTIFSPLVFHCLRLLEVWFATGRLLRK